MSQPGYPQPAPPYQHYPPIVHVAKTRNRAAATALILALLAGLAAALNHRLGVASHTWAFGCIVDRRLEVVAEFFALIGGLLSVGAAVTGLISVINRRHRARGAYLVMGIAALVIGVVGAILSFRYFSVSTAPHAIPPRYLHPC